MKTNVKLTWAVLAALAAQSGVTFAADTDPSTGLDEIVVTAQRRSESIQNVPITIQAFSGDQLKQLGLANLDDFVKYLPNVTMPTNGPGQGNIYMRGLSAGFAGNQSSSTIAPFPNVALYLDDQAMQFPARNADVYMVDMERVEVLEGPQGTLFGGGAEAGAIRYITNKPKLNVTEGNVDAGYGVTAGGDPNTNANMTLNLPLIQDKLAVRATIYDDRRGGYITNVPSTFTRRNSDTGASVYFNGVPDINQNGNNFTIAGRAQNPLSYSGIRVSALYQINDDWNALVTQSYQNMEADGYFAQFPRGSDYTPGTAATASTPQLLGPYQITAFSPAYDKDKYSNTAWTVNGKFGDLHAVYTGAFMSRDIAQQQDYTNYSRTAYGYYYSCTGGPAALGALGAGTTPRCYSPITSWEDTVHNTHQSHEFRLSTPDTWTVRGIAGAYWEDFKIEDNMNFNYKTIPACNPTTLPNSATVPCVANVAPAPGSTATDPSVRSDLTAFGEDAQRGYKQTALFGSVDYDLLPKTLTFTAGTRWYHYSEFETGSVYTTGGRCVNLATPCYANAAHNIDAEGLRSTYSGFRSKANLTWHIDANTMAYYTFSQGFRPGAFNRTVAGVAKDANGQPQFEKPHGYGPDQLINNEIGLKTELFDRRLMLNLSAYHMNWNDVQVLFFNPVALGNTTFGTNGPNYTINGVELQFASRVTDALTVQGSGSYNSSKQTNSPCLVSNIPASPTYGQCITEVKGKPFNNPFGAEGGTPANSPNLQFNLRARYDWMVNEYKYYAMVGASYMGSSFNQPATASSGEGVLIPTTTLLRYEMPSYTTYDAALGVAKDRWTVQVIGSNLSNSNASQFTSSAQFIESQVPLRPRVLGVKLGYKF